MAITGLQRLASQNSCNPSLSLYCRAIITRSSVSSSSLSNKVSHQIVKLFGIDFANKKLEIVGLSGHSLLKALSNHDLIDLASHRLEDIGACSAECEVNIAQVVLSLELQGIVITVPKAKPWDIP